MIAVFEKFPEPKLTDQFQAFFRPIAVIPAFDFRAAHMIYAADLHEPPALECLCVSLCASIANSPMAGDVFREMGKESHPRGAASWFFAQP
jgi:hypothetical protein